MTKEPKPHLETIDSLRGIAALSVCLFHFSGLGLIQVMHEPTRTLFSWGWLGVEIFFVISGFIIPYVMMRGAYDLTQFGSFMGKRFVRICPPAYLVTLLTVTQYFVMERVLHSKTPWFSKLSVPQVLHQMAFSIPFTDYTWINGIFWTLAVELQFYLLIALTFRLVFHSVRHFIIATIVLGAAFYLPLYPLQFFHYSSLFLMGGLTALWIARQIGKADYLMLLGVLGVLGFFQLGLWPTIFGVGTAIAIAFLNVRSAVGEFFGRISYSLYLLHILVGTSLEFFLIKLLRPTGIANLIGIQVLCLGGAILGAWAFHHLIERHFVRLSGMLFQRRESGPRSSSSELGTQDV